jgi:DNA replication and repair protein RecF
LKDKTGRSLEIQSIKLIQFKNYREEFLLFSPALNCILGLNGMGKTNLLEAIYYLCMCKNSRSLSDRRLILHGCSFFRLEGHFLKQEGKEDKVVAKVAPGRKKEFERNGAPYERLSEHVGRFPVVFISPDDSSLVVDGSEERRRFLDNTLSQIDSQYLQSLILYNRLLKQRNASLKQFQESGYFEGALLDTYDAQLIQPAEYVFQKRTTFVQELTPLFQNYYQNISSGKEAVNCFYSSALQEASFQELLSGAREKDRMLGRTTEGIHRDDLDLKLDGMKARRLASQGQLKSFVLALRLAQFALLKKEKEITPILLLDDIFDKLDEQRVKHLLRLLSKEPFGQVFVTDAYKHRLPELLGQLEMKAEHFIIHQGEIVREN